MNKCIVLCSSGIDSTSCLYWARKNYDYVLAMFVDYGQKNPFEKVAFRRIMEDVRVDFFIQTVNLRQMGGSALTDEIDVPKDRSAEEIETGIPITFVPGRNILFLTLAGALAYLRKISDIVIAVNVIDFSGYPDCTPLFINRMEAALTSGLDKKMQIVTPVIYKKKAEIIKFGLDNGADFSYSISCYEDEIPCGVPKNSQTWSDAELQEALGGCDSCQLRAKGFRELNMLDPLLVRLRKEGKI